MDGTSSLRRRLRRIGAGLSSAGVAVLAWGALAAPSQAPLLNARLASTGPPCGAGELCIKESQVPTTAVGFGSGCGDLVSAHPDEDLWHFVIPSGASFDTDTSHFTAIFTDPSGQIHADSIGGPNDQFAFVYSPAGATLTWAFATNVTGTATQGYFVLSGTCAASQTSSSSSTSSSTSSSSSSSSSSTTSTSGTGGVSGSSTTTDGGGVAGITTPSTGSGGGAVVPLGLGLLLIGGACVRVAGRRRTG